MRYLIDGYNLVFRVLPHYIPLHHRRQMTVTELSEKISALQLDVAIIFDAHQTLEEYSRGHLAGLEIHYTAHQQTADDWILDSIAESKTPGNLTVVTSDNQLAWQCRMNGAHIVDVKTFLVWLEKRYDSKVLKETPPPSQQPVFVQPAAKSSPVLPKKKPARPSPLLPADECMNYYLEAFSKNLPVEEPLPEKPLVLKKAPPEKEIPEGKELDENLLDHYERIFREKLQKSEEL